MLNKTFHELEHEGWSERASFYDDLFAGVSAQAIAPILDSLGDLQGKHLLDVACGTGHLVAAADKRGAISTGIDFAEPMVNAARANYPTQCFNVADATQLPYEDASFDAVTCSFGLSHMEFPRQAVTEAFRVLKPAGRFAFTLWFGPDDGGELLAIGRDAIAAHATTSMPLPSAWTQLRFADEQACTTIVREAGFEAPRFLRLPIILQTATARAVFDVLVKLSVRSRMILDSQPPAIQQRINEYILSEIEARRVDGLITVRWLALLTITQKPKFGGEDAS